jgi:hypothetical protein
MTRNYALIEQVWQFIKDNPRKHRQRAWFSDCGTAACFAGWAVQMEGYEQAGLVSVRRCDDESKRHPVGTLAQDLLGLSPHEGNTLFHSGNSRPMLELMVKDLLNGDELKDRKFYWHLRREQLRKEREDNARA